MFWLWLWWRLGEQCAAAGGRSGWLGCGGFCCWWCSWWRGVVRCGGLRRGADRLGFENVAMWE